MIQINYYLDWLKTIGGNMGWAANIFSIIVPLFGFISAIVAFFKFVAKKLHIRKLLQSPVPDGAGAIIVCIGPRVPTEKAEAFLKENHPGVPVLLKYHKAEFLTPGQLLEVFEKIKEQVFTLCHKGELKEIWLFYGGPVTLAAALGALFINWLPVKLYALENGSFVYQFPVEKSLIKGACKKGGVDEKSDD